MDGLQLREFVTTHLESAEDKCDLVVCCGDHAYRKVSVEVADAEMTKDGSLYEYYSKADMSPGSKKVKVILFN